MPTVDHTAVLAASEGSFLIKPGVGLMIWTLVVFGVTMLALRRYAFPAISKALDSRQKAIEDSIDTAERTRKEADELLTEGQSFADTRSALAEFYPGRLVSGSDGFEFPSLGWLRCCWR